MKKIGFVIISIGFIAGALFTAISKTEVVWPPFIIALLAGVVGIVLIKVSDKKASKSKEVIAENMGNINKSLSNIVKNLKDLNDKKDEINTYDVRHKVDELFIEDINDFAEARESISHTYGMQAYAEIMNCFAAGERYLNRVWSASADGYIDEVNAYLDKSYVQFEEASKKLESMQG